MTRPAVLCGDGQTVHDGPDTGEMPTSTDSAAERAARLDRLGVQCHSVREVDAP